jgi:NADH:ubiquinone oxidoreductase subunit H
VHAIALLGRMSAMGAVLACACAQSGTRALDGIVAPQGAWPWQWGVLQHVALLAALPLFVVYGAQIGDAEPHALESSRMAQRLMTLERVLTNVVLAAFGAAIFFGGWQSPLWMTLGPWPERLPGALLFVLKAWGVAFVLAEARRRGAQLRKRVTWTLCAVLVALTSLEVLLEPSPSIVRFTGELLGIAVLTAGVIALGQRALIARARRPALSIAFGAK